MRMQLVGTRYVHVSGISNYSANAKTEHFKAEHIIGTDEKKNCIYYYVRMTKIWLP